MSEIKVHTRTAQISIDAEALRHNLQRVKTFSPDSKVIAVVKANAYGHGDRTAIEALSDADLFALATPNEAISLRRSGISRPLLVLQGFSGIEELTKLAGHDIQIVVHQTQQIDLLERCPDLKLDVWLKADTGMHRLGMPVEKVESAYQRLKACESVKDIHLMSHFANADEPAHPMNKTQLSVFMGLSKNIEQCELSLANSAALIAISESRLQWVRPGIMLYGASPLAGKTAEELGLAPVMQFESKIVAVQTLKKGDDIGYGSVWRCPEDMRMGVVAAGYADGYPRHAGIGTPVWVNNTLCPLVGRVSMDSLCVDLRGVDADVGDRAVLWGKELSVDVVAKNAETISYEILCHAGASLL